MGAKQNVVPAADHAKNEAVLAYNASPTTEIAANLIVAASAYTNGRLTVEPAGPTEASTLPLLLTKHKIPPLGFGICVPWAALSDFAVLDSLAVAGQDDEITAQPAAGSVLTVVSDNAGDTSVAITIYGLGDNGQAISEVITTHAANGTTAVNGTKVFTAVHLLLKAVTLGTITVSDDDPATIATLTAAVISRGRAVGPTDQSAGGVSFVADAATTAKLTLVGTDTAGAAQIEVITLAGTTTVSSALTWGSWTHYGFGAVPAARTITISANIYADNQDELYVTTGGRVTSLALGDGTDVPVGVCVADDSGDSATGAILFPGFNAIGQALARSKAYADAAIAAAVVAASTIPAGVLTVGTSGADYTAIETALAAAAAGQTVWVFPGTYVIPAAGLSVPAGVTLQGVSRDEVVLTSVANNPANAITLAAGSGLTNIELLMGDVAGRVGVLMSGDGSITTNVRVGAATAANTATGIRVTGSNCEAAGVMFYTALATLINVVGAGGGVGSLYAHDIATAGEIAGRAASYLIEVTGTMRLQSAVLRATNAEGIRADGTSFSGTLDAWDTQVSVGGTNGVNVDVGATVSLFGCVTPQTLTGAGSGSPFYGIYGSRFGTVSIPAGAGASSVLPSRSGTAVVLNLGTSIVVPVATIGGAAYDGKPVLATLKEANAAVAVANCTWDGSGNLTINLTAAATADRDVSWFIPG